MNTSNGIKSQADFYTFFPKKSFIYRKMCTSFKLSKHFCVNFWLFYSTAIKFTEKSMVFLQLFFNFTLSDKNIQWKFSKKKENFRIFQEIEEIYK